MPVLSILRRTLPLNQSLCKVAFTHAPQVRNHGQSKMYIRPSSWSWHKFKDLFHFYVMVGVIPLSALVMYVNIFTGPAQLAEIPEGHYPEKHEYYKHPICRWFSKHIYASHQEEYEKLLQYMYEENEKIEMSLIEKDVQVLMYNRGDSRAAYFRAPVLDYIKLVRKNFDREREYHGEM